MSSRSAMLAAPVIGLVLAAGVSLWTAAVGPPASLAAPPRASVAAPAARGATAAVMAMTPRDTPRPNPAPSEPQPTTDPTGSCPNCGAPPPFAPGGYLAGRTDEARR